MTYMLKVDVLVAAVLFGLGGVIILGLFAWAKAKEYAHALRAMERIAAAGPRESFVISRTRSRNHNTDSVGAA